MVINSTNIHTTNVLGLVSIWRYTITDAIRMSIFYWCICSKMLDDNEAMDSVFEDVDNPHLQRPRNSSVPLNAFDTRVDRVYTVGCFDLFHTGHITLLQRMQALGKQVSSNYIGFIAFLLYILLQLPQIICNSSTLHEKNPLPSNTYQF